MRHTRGVRGVLVALRVASEGQPDNDTTYGLTERKAILVELCLLIIVVVMDRGYIVGKLNNFDDKL